MTPTVHLCLSMNEDYRGRGTPYLHSLEKHCRFPVTLFNVDCGMMTGLGIYEQVQVKTSEFRGHCHKSRFMMQAGQFLDFWKCDEDDVVIFTDADIILQRPFMPDEVAFFEGLEGLSAGINQRPGATLLDEAEGLYCLDWGFLERTFPGYQMNPIYNTGVLAGPRWAWDEMFERYVTHYPNLFRGLAHYAAVQWLICYVIGNVIEMPPWIHSHGHFGTPSGVTFLDGIPMTGGRPVAMRHRL